MLYFGGISPSALPSFGHPGFFSPPMGGTLSELDDGSPREVPPSARLVGSKVVPVGAPAAPAMSNTEAVTSRLSRSASFTPQSGNTPHRPRPPSVRPSTASSSSRFGRGSNVGRDPLDRMPSTTEMRQALIRSASAKGSFMRSESRVAVDRPTVSSASRSLSAKALLSKPNNTTKAAALEGEITGLRRKIGELRELRRRNQETIEVLTQVVRDLGRSRAFANSLVRSQSMKGPFI